MAKDTPPLLCRHGWTLGHNTAPDTPVIATSSSGVIGERHISSGVIGDIDPSMTVTKPMGGSTGFAIGCALLIQWLDEDLLAWRGSAGFGGLCNWSCMFFGFFFFFFFCFFVCCGSSAYCNSSSSNASSGQCAARFALALKYFATQLVCVPAGSALPPRRAMICFFSYVQLDVRMLTHVEMKQA